jgi:hypothetical protein
MSALTKQIAGNHYKGKAIQPVEYVHANGIGFFEGNVIKYVTRWRDKNGLDDLEKAKHYIEMLIELETRNAKRNTRASTRSRKTGSTRSGKARRR